MNVWAKLEKQKTEKLQTNIIELKKMARMYEKFGMESQAADIIELLRAAEADPRLVKNDPTLETI